MFTGGFVVQFVEPEGVYCAP